MSFFFNEVVLMQFARKRFLHERLLYLPERLRKFLSPIWDQGLSENLAQALPAEACKSSASCFLTGYTLYKGLIVTS